MPRSTTRAWRCGCLLIAAPSGCAFSSGESEPAEVELSVSALEAQQSAAPAAAALAAAQPAAKKDDPVPPIEQQSADQRQKGRQADAMAQRSALATERAVLAEMKTARASGTQADIARADARITKLQDGITRREQKLSQLEAPAQP